MVSGSDLGNGDSSSDPIRNHCVHLCMLVKGINPSFFPPVIDKIAGQTGSYNLGWQPVLENETPNAKWIALSVYTCGWGPLVNPNSH